MFPKRPSESDVKEVLENLKREGIVEIALKYTFKVDKEKLEQLEEKNHELLKATITNK